MLSRTAIGGLLLESIDGWSFYVQADGAIAGQYVNDTGILRIFKIPSEELKQPVSHEQCLAIAAVRADLLADAKPLERRMDESISGPYGCARYRRDDDVVRVWYCNRAPGLVVGIYACSLASSCGIAYPLIKRHCAEMIGSAMFDRVSWGGDDVLTKFLVEHLKDEESFLDNDCLW